MLPLGLVLFGAAVAGPGSTGALMLSAFGVTSAFAPLRARVVDRVGAFALRALVTAFALLLGVLLVAGALDAGVVALVLASGLVGAAAPPLGPYTRAELGRTLRRRPEFLRRAFALDSAAEEGALVAAPLAVAAVVAVTHPGLALALAGLLMLAGGLRTAASGRQATVATGAVAASVAVSGTGGGVVERARLPRRAWLLVGTLAAPGAALGVVDVVVPALAREAGHPAAAGVLLAVLSAGTVAGGLLAGRLRTLRPAGRLAPLGLLLAATLTPAALAGGGLATLAAALLAPGVVLGMLFVTAYVALDEAMPSVAATRGFAWVTTVNNGGVAAGAAFAGLVPAVGLWPAVLVAPLATVLAALAARS
jgi:hypothetical protein